MKSDERNYILIKIYTRGNCLLLGLAAIVILCGLNFDSSDHSYYTADNGSTTNDTNQQNSTALHVTATPSYLPADGISCFKLTIGEAGEQQKNRMNLPYLESSLGAIENLRAGPDGGWEADLCGGTETGLARLAAAGYQIIDPPSLYFIPPVDYPPSGPVEVTSFTATIDPLKKTVEFRVADILDAYSIELSAYLYPARPFFFDGNTVGIAPVIEGTATPLDLLDVRAQIDNISSPSVSVNECLGYAPEDSEIISYYYGGFLASARAMADGDSLSKWGMPWCFHFDNKTAFTINGTVRAWLPAPRDEVAQFRIRPFLTKAAKNSMTVSWETDTESRSFVVYGPTPACEYVAAGTSERNRFLVQWPMHFNSFHRAVMTGLEPGATYYYRVIAAKDPTQPEDFRAAAGIGMPFSFGVIGDTRTRHSHHRALIDQMSSQTMDFYLHAGDLVDFSGVEKEWLTFFDIESSLMKNRPVYPTLGNHDITSRDKFYLRYFEPDSPYGDSVELKGRMYSFDYGHAHFVTIDTELPFDPGSPQYQWLEQDLQAAAANPERKFTFLFQHKPIYSAFAYAANPEARNYIEPLCRAYGVDAVFAGHVHQYERSDVMGRPYILTGSGGAPFSLFVPKLPLNPYYVTSFIIKLEFLRVDVKSDSFDIYAIDDKGAIFDQVHYSKP